MGDPCVLLDTSVLRKQPLAKLKIYVSVIMHHSSLKRVSRGVKSAAESARGRGELPRCERMREDKNEKEEKWVGGILRAGDRQMDLHRYAF